MTTLDWSHVIAGINAEMGRLGWSVQQGREYLEATYGVRSRQQLTDNQLLEFWEYLKAQTLPACLRCKSENVEDRLLENGPHYAQRVCLDCGYKAQFLPKPTTPKPTRRKGSTGLLADIKKGFCHICLRKEAELPGKIHLLAHHIIPVEEGGADDPGNLLEVCSECHKDIHRNQVRYKPYREQGFFLTPEMGSRSKVLSAS